MVIKTLDKYILKKLTVLFLIILPAFTIVSLLVQILEKIKNIKTLELQNFILYLIFNIPEKLYYLAPISLVIAVLILYKDIIQTKQIYAILTNGISIRYISTLAIVFSIFITFFQIINLELFMPTSNYLKEEYYKKLKGETPTKEKYIFVSNIWLKLTDYKYVYFGFLDLNRYTGKEFILINMDKNTFFPKSRIEAKQIEINKNSINLTNGKIIKISDIENFSFKNFKKINYPIKIDTKNLRKLIKIKKPVSATQLLRKAIIADKFGYPSAFFWSRFYSKIATVFSPLVLVVLITPLIWINRKEKYLYIFGAVFLYWYGISTFKSLSSSGALPYFSPVILDIVYLSIGIYLLSKQRFIERIF